jgi:periplasmic copper chaperone A
MRNLRALLAATLLACFTLCGCQREPHIEVSHARSGALPPTATVGAAYMRIESTTPDELLSAETPVAGDVQFHTTQNSHGMMQMRELHQLLIEPGRPLEFAPGANHMMLMGLRQPLSVGNTFALTLHFKRAGNVAVIVQVQNDVGE